eukprot:TRINITY_DN104_c0_g1_i1.p1 TRINITY_DN104_c0_g1~~TRINITY_DN104_c0_g1_i1.p1  ORF type:complete len:539 (-),score=56.39 TRINITY_DN104_c0_g1_i1:40-1656(-)
MGEDQEMDYDLQQPSVTSLTIFTILKIASTDMEVLTEMVYNEKWHLEPLVIPWRKYKQANFLIAHQVVDLQFYAEHFSTWNYLFENNCIAIVQAQLNKRLDKKMKQRLLIDALKSELSTTRVRKIVFDWGLDIRGLDIFPVIKKVGDRKWNMQTILLLAPLVAQLVALGASCAIFHPCSSLIIRACRAGIITNLLLRCSKNFQLVLPEEAMIHILQFVSSTNAVNNGGTYAANRAREGNSMMNNVFRMLGTTTTIIYDLGVDCTPYPGGNIRLAENLKTRNEYGSNSEFMPPEEQYRSIQLNNAKLQNGTRTKRKWNTRFTSEPSMAESKVDTPFPSKVGLTSTRKNRARYPGFPETFFSGYNYNREKFNAQKSNSCYTENTCKAKQACYDIKGRSTCDNFKSKSAQSSIGLQDRKFNQIYNPDAQLLCKTSQTDVELKMRWMMKKSNSQNTPLLPINIDSQKYWYAAAPKPDEENLFKWTPQKFKRLQARIRARGMRKGVLAMPSEERPNGRKANQFSEGFDAETTSLLNHQWLPEV